MKRGGQTVKVGSVSLPVYPYGDAWRFAWKDERGEWRYVTRKDKKTLLELAREKARKIHNGTASTDFTPDQISLLRRVLELGITHAELDKIEREKGRVELPLSTAVDEFLAVKTANKGRSGKNVKSLRSCLNGMRALLGEMVMREVHVSDLDRWLASYGDVSPRRKKNLRSGAVTFFRWARDRGYVADDRKTAACKLERGIVPKKVPATWAPQEMKHLLANCPEPYIPWLVCAGFEGVRHEELIMDSESTKSPLDWSDFHWSRDIIIVRPETAKTGDRRVIPILPVTRAWLYDRRKESGPVCPQASPHRSPDRKSPTLTKRLGEGVGGWRVNALRHSFISYRAAEAGLAQAAMEAGNSEAEAKRSYNDAKGRDEAALWFALIPSEVFGTDFVSR